MVAVVTADTSGQVALSKAPNKRTNMFNHDGIRA